MLLGDEPNWIGMELPGFALFCTVRLFVTGSQKTIRVNDPLPFGTDVSTKIHGSAPVISEGQCTGITGVRGLIPSGGTGTDIV